LITRDGGRFGRSDTDESNRKVLRCLAGWQFQRTFPLENDLTIAIKDLDFEKGPDVGGDRDWEDDSDWRDFACRVTLDHSLSFRSSAYFQPNLHLAVDPLSLQL
jgi:hypothetical protein